MGLEVLTCSQAATKTSYAWASSIVVVVVFEVNLETP